MKLIYSGVLTWWILHLFLLSAARAQENVILEWQATYFGPDTLSTPVGLAADRFGSIYVTGYTFVAGVRWDIATAKYTSVGEQVWVDRTPHPENYSSFPVGVIVDNNLLYVGSHHGNPGTGGGSNQSVIQYDLDGNQIWLTRFEGRQHGNVLGIDVDGEGNIYLCGYGFDSAGRFGVDIAKLDTNGVIVWSEKFDGEDPHEGYVPQAMAIDHAGSIIITGYIVMTETSDTFTIKYDSNGELLWFARYGGQAAEFPYAITVDGDNDIYVVGSGFLIIKYDSSGTQEWLHMYDGPVAAYDVAIDPMRNVDIAAGIYNYDTQESDFLTLQCTRDGDKLWERRFNGDENGSEWPVAMSLDAHGNIYVTGSSTFNRGLKRICYTLKYSIDGQEQWGVKYEGDGHLKDTPRAMALDDSSNVYIALKSVLGPSRSTYTILKYRQSQNVTYVDANSAHLAGFQLHGNYPNPFNPQTTIRYDLPAQTQVRLTIFDVLGRTVRTLVAQKQPAGTHTVRWDGRDSRRQQLASGLYFYRLEAGEFRKTAKMLLLK